MGIKRFKAALLSTLIITSLAAFLLVITAAKPIEATPDLCENFKPIHDTHVMEGYPDTVQYDGEPGEKYNCYMGYDEQIYHSERIYAKFDLSVVPAGAVTSARLWTNNKYSPSIGESPYTPTNLTIEAYGVEDDDWLESTLTWNIAEANHPPVGSVIDTQTILSTDTYHWEYWDVTTYVQQEVVTDKIVTICLKTTAENTEDSTVWIYAKDAYEDQPWMRLEVCWRGVGVEISPCEKKGLRGEDVTFTVTVRNETGSPDTFSLEADSEWVTSLPSSTGLIPEGGSEDVTLTVTIPEDACLGSEDEITVTATASDPTIFNYASCFAGVPPIYPSDDAEVNSYYPDKNYDDNDRITLGTEIEDETWVQMDWTSYLMFDLSEDIPSGSTIDSAHLSLFTHFGGENGSDRYAEEEWLRYGDENVSIAIKKVANDDWTEDMITWNTAPSMGNPIFTGQIISEKDDQRYEWDITSYVREEWAGDKKVSIGLVSEEEGQNKFLPFITKETEHVRCEHETDWRPYLILCYTPGVPAPDVSVSIEPEENKGAPGENVTFTVTVTNTGVDVDTYDLTVEDTKDWSLSLPSSVGPLDPGEDTEVILEVAIPSTAESCTGDTITVTATSRADPGVSDDDSCVAHAYLGPDVSVSISPPSRSAAPGGTATFTVTITNEGNVTDTYALENSDTAGWALSLSQDSVGPLAPDASADVTLTVTIPSTAGDGDSTTVTVAATSTENTEVSASDTCTARAVIGVGGVEVTIDQTTKSGAPGEELNFFVTITNTGTVEDTYDLTASDTEDWGATLAVQSTTLAGGASRTGIKLTVPIPDDAAEGNSTTVTVTATGTGYHNSATCTATAKAPSGFPIVIPVAAVVVIVVIIGAALAIRH